MKPFTPISRIKIDRGKCVGCRICEAVCNFHFKEQGNLETPALQIYRDTYTGKINYHVLENCDLCIKTCPAKAFDPTKQYPYSYDRVKCMAKRAEIAKKGLYCHNCYAVCQVGHLKDEELLSIKEARSIYKPTTTSKN